jgi:hypothetical protein
MESSELEVGRSYAYRAKRATDSPMLRVNLIDFVGRKGKLKVRFENGPHPGLEEYVRSRQLVCAWGQRRTVLRDEESVARLREYVSRLGAAERALIEAASAVLASSG